MRATYMLNEFQAGQFDDGVVQVLYKFEDGVMKEVAVVSKFFDAHSFVLPELPRRYLREDYDADYSVNLGAFDGFSGNINLLCPNCNIKFYGKRCNGATITLTGDKKPFIATLKERFWGKSSYFFVGDAELAGKSVVLQEGARKITLDFKDFDLASPREKGDYKNLQIVMQENCNEK